MSVLPDLAQFAIKQSPKKVGDETVPRVVDDELAKLGWSDNARLSFLGDVGRENSWNRDTIFAGHNDPANNARNRGIISWQGDRREKLDNFLKQDGSYGKNDDNELRGMVRFMDSEMRDSPEWKNIHSKMRDPNISTYDASENLRRYIKYNPGGKYNTSDPDFRVANNAKWAKKAEGLGLGRLPDLSGFSTDAKLPDLSQFNIGQAEQSPEPPQRLSGTDFLEGGTANELLKTPDITEQFPGGKSMSAPPSKQLPSKQPVVPRNAPNGGTVEVSATVGQPQIDDSRVTESPTTWKAGDKEQSDDELLSGGDVFHINLKGVDKKNKNSVAVQQIVSHLSRQYGVPADQIISHLHGFEQGDIAGDNEDVEITVPRDVIASFAGKDAVLKKVKDERRAQIEPLYEQQRDALVKRQAEDPKLEDVSNKAAQPFDENIKAQAIQNIDEYLQDEQVPDEKRRQMVQDEYRRLSSNENIENKPIEEGLRAQNEAGNATLNKYLNYGLGSAEQLGAGMLHYINKLPNVNLTGDANDEHLTEWLEKKLRAYGNTREKLSEEAPKPESFLGELADMGAKSVYDLPRIFSLPGGAAMTFGGDTFLKDVGEKNGADIESIKKGGQAAILGKILEVAGGAGKFADSTNKLIQRGVSLGSVVGATTGVGLLEGQNPKDAFKEGIKMGLFDIVMHAGGDAKALKDVVFKATDGKNETYVTVKPDGEAIEVEKPEQPTPILNVSERLTPEELEQQAQFRKQDKPAKAKTPAPVDIPKTMGGEHPSDLKTDVELRAENKPVESPVKEKPVTPAPEAKKPTAPTTGEMAGVKKPKLPPMEDNYLKDLSHYTPKLYRETSAENALEIVSKNSLSKPEQLFVANTPNLAKGQGQNKGVLIEMNSQGIRGQVNRSKPGFEIAYENGEAEFQAKHIKGKTLEDNVTKVTLMPEAFKQTRGKLLDTTLTKQGWVRTTDGDNVVFTRSSLLPNKGKTEIADDLNPFAKNKIITTDKVEVTPLKIGDEVTNGNYTGKVFKDKSGELRVERKTGQIHPLSEAWGKTGKQLALEKRILKESKKTFTNAEGLKIGDAATSEGNTGKVYSHGGKLRVKYEKDGSIKSEPINDSWKKAEATPSLTKKSLSEVPPKPKDWTPETGAVSTDLLTAVPRMIKAAHDYISVEPIPKLQKAEVGEEARRHAAARIAVPHVVNDYLAKVFPNQYLNPEAMSRTVDILNKDNILGGYYEFLDRAEKARDVGDDAAAEKWQQRAENIGEVNDIDALQSEVEASQGDPEISDNIERWKKVVNPALDEMYNKMKGVDPDTPREGRGAVYGARINLLPENKAAEMRDFSNLDQPMPAPITANYRNPNVKRDQFDRAAKFTGNYSTNAQAVLTNALGNRLNETTKLDLYKAIEDKGVGVMVEPGENAPTDINGQKAVRLPVKVPHTNAEGKTTVVERSLYVQQDIAREMRDVLNTDMKLTPNPVGQFLTQIQVAQLADMTAHLKNIHSVIAAAPATKSALADMARRFPGVGTVDAITRIAMVSKQVVSDTPAIREEIADMAKLGLIRTKYPSTGLQRLTKAQDLIHAVDTASRITMNRFFTKLAEAGRVEDTPQNRASFVQQIGEYNDRLMSPLMRAAKQSGLSPFIVAGRNFNRQGIRLVTGSPGVKASSTTEAAKMRMGNLIAGLGAAAVVPAILNLFSTGSMGGRPGTPLGAWDMGGEEDEHGKHKVLDVMQLLGIRRGLRATGANTVIEGLREGKSAGEMADAAIKDAVSTQAHPWLGPALGFAFQTLTGSRLDLRGGPIPAEARNMGGSGQYKENARVALKNQNRLLYELASPLIGTDEENAEKGYGSRIAEGLFKSPISAAGISDVQSPAMKLAQEIQRAKGVFTKTPEQAKSRSVANDLLTRADNGEDVDADIEKAVNDGVITERQVKNLTRNRALSPLAAKVKYMSLIPDAIRVWERASKKERQDISATVAKKIENAEKKGELSDADKETLDNLGFDIHVRKAPPKLPALPKAPKLSKPPGVTYRDPE